MSQDANRYPPLPAPIEAALRDSIKLRGVIYPVVRDQHGGILDGHHRARIADEEGVPYTNMVIHVKDDDEAREVSRTLNEDRRSIPIEQRRAMVAQLVSASHSRRAIAGALGISESTAWHDIQAAKRAGGSHEPPATQPRRVVGLDGRSYPSRKRVLVAQDGAGTHGPSGHQASGPARRREKPAEKYAGALPMVERARDLLEGAGTVTVVGRYRGPILRIAARVARIADAMRAERSAGDEPKQEAS